MRRLETTLRLRERSLAGCPRWLGPVMLASALVLVARRGAGELPEGFWGLPWPEDPEASVRMALEEDRR